MVYYILLFRIDYKDTHNYVINQTELSMNKKNRLLLSTNAKEIT
jgi:hypothetical protein